MNAVSNLPKPPVLGQNKSPKTNPSLLEQSTVSNLHNNSQSLVNREQSQKTIPSSQFQENLQDQGEIEDGESADLGGEYVMFIQQENESLRGEIEQIHIQMEEFDQTFE